MPCEPWTAPWRLIRNARTGAARLGRKKRSSNGVSERPRYGRIGCLALPYLWLFELFAPVVEIVGIVTIILAACLGVLSREFFLQFLIFGYAGHLHRLGSAGRDYLQTLQRLAGCSAARQLLLLRAFSLPAIAHDLAATGSLAVPARRLRLETPEAQRTAIRTSPVRPARGSCGRAQGKRSLLGARRLLLARTGNPTPERSSSPVPLSRQAATGFQIGEEALNLGVAVQARQFLSDVVGQ